MPRNSRQDLNPTIPILSAMMEARFWLEAPEKWWKHDYWKVILAFSWIFFSPFQGLLLAWCVCLPRKWGPRLTGLLCRGRTLWKLLFWFVVSIGIQRFLSSCHCPLLKVWLKPRLNVRRNITWVIHRWCVNAVVTQYSKYRYDDIMIYGYILYWYLCFF